MTPITIIGGGLAGCEAAFQILKRGGSVRLIDMKPGRKSPAHESDGLAELVCSNSLRSDDPTSAVGLLKREMAALDSLFIEAARATAVPAGRALAVNRDDFSQYITERIKNHPQVEVIEQEVLEIPPETDAPVILATGPLTSEPLAESLAAFTGRDRLAFYDAIAPIVYKDSLNFDIVYSKSRWEDGPGDYLNCPMNEEEYLRFITELASAEYMPLKDFEKAKYFEGCLPVEIIRSRGDDTLRFGPMKPVGLEKPDGSSAYAVVQLRKETKAGTTYNMVGFQTKLTYPEQKRVFRLIPGMENVEFARLGSIHRNTFIVAPELLRPTLQFQQRADLLLAGQLSGVEGYVESAAMGLLAGINAARLAAGIAPTVPPQHTAFGALIHHLTESEAKHFQPSNVNFGLFPDWKKKIRKKFRGEERAKLSAAAMETWLAEM
ncbi:methylenetetrahydrofolate--tRNA-(uracil(54)-C(5))-methyltransferase (FADH(2)-oxidizing) TrmFO [Desulforhopalus vacuolatus]|uniref:methylenetetrahydrofolate--tRNA-(uracil(54)- C(5))-methyltransferase (FADH(2)-oxidizing) TrmFO n=1 Tax=Desulforhopalus vacuolatus TaxID=40414 RepID=UPI001962DD5E|nr:methylenetetrahydrofolate--tRNA-(uracil(54)-C(5))-methyltransferase (FADH(2)-oxidizing) TrmFO [Desulforhopalus vacuolatus]MBM9518731.1 methylenetetrahydrofolate--tRNA-(uracil(54)-C(5))-methyltransferase (FADH(2)-oxidizing) TrmFO [Desulforhopalus vacuolatus]